MKELLFSLTKKDWKVDYFSGTGAGGQHRNKHQNCVRLHHRASGVTTTGQSNRERKANVKEAFDGLLRHPKFRIWHAGRVQEALTGKSIEDVVNEMMQPENLKIEVKEKGKWQQGQGDQPEERIDENNRPSK